MRKITNSFSVLLIVTVLASSCQSYKLSNKKNQESVDMVMIEKDDVLDKEMLAAQMPKQNQMVSRGVPLALIGPGVSLAIKGLKNLIDADKKNYTANYQSSVNQLYFYNNVSLRSALDYEGMQFYGFTIIRTIKNGNSEDTAMLLKMAVDRSNLHETINNSIFRLVVEDFKLKYAKAKVPTYRWYLPWTYFLKNDKKVHFDIEVVIKASWLSADGTFNQNIELGRFLLNLRDIPLDPNDPNYEQKQKDVIGKQLQGYSFMVPRSYGSVFVGNEIKPGYGQGRFSIATNITEAGKSRFVTKIIQDNSGQLTDELEKNLIKLINK